MRSWPRVILASQSPRRRELLKIIFDTFEVEASDLDEPDHLTGDLESAVRTLARAKARHIALENPDALVIGADTIVVLDGQILGKPADALDAANMLSALSGRTHKVLTGIAVCHGQHVRTARETTEVTFAPISSQQISDYIASGEPFDKAGAYGIQGKASLFVEGIRGCYFNVVGLPVFRLGRMLEHFSNNTDDIDEAEL